MNYEDITLINGSSILLNEFSNRIYLTNINTDNIGETISEVDKIAKQELLLKIIAKVPENAKGIFLDSGYKIEAHIPGYYNGESDVYFMGKFLAKERELFTNGDEIQDVLKTSFEKKNSKIEYNLEEEFTWRKIEEFEIEDLINLYRKVFESYPSPIFDPKYILETMHTNSDYLGIYKDGKLIATAASEKDPTDGHAEISAVAVLDEYRGKNFSIFLINELEKILKQENYKISYSIARANSYGMNITFAKMGYIFAGTLVNNTHISGNLQHMNVWYKVL